MRCSCPPAHRRRSSPSCTARWTRSCASRPCARAWPRTAWTWRAARPRRSARSSRRRSPNGRASSPRPRSRWSDMTNPLPLAGLRVIEPGQVLAGPFAGAIFADLGADLIKVERPEGDDGRRIGAAFRYGDSMTFHEFNRNKKSVTIDLKSPDGVAQLEALAATADILVHNLRPGSADALGIGGARLTSLFPRLIYCEMGAFGHQGPMRLTPGYEPIMQAFAGLSA